MRFISALYLLMLNFKVREHIMKQAVREDWPWCGKSITIRLFNDFCNDFYAVFKNGTIYTKLRLEKTTCFTIRTRLGSKI